MMRKTSTLALAAGCFVALGLAAPPAHAQQSPQLAYAGPEQIVTNGPQASRGADVGWSARQDVINSRRYDRLLETNMAFRRFRERKECGPIGDPQLRQQCLASFAQYEPLRYGS